MNKVVSEECDLDVSRVGELIYFYIFIFVKKLFIYFLKLKDYDREIWF